MFLSNNPYRVIGIPSNSGLKIIQKNLSKLKAFSKLGKPLSFDYDLSFLNLAPIDRSSKIIAKVESRILLDENKVMYSLFWFQDITSYDSIALANLIKGDKEKAIEIWTKTLKSGEVNIKNFSSYNNISTLQLLLQLETSKKDQFKNDPTSISKLKQAIEKKIKLINSEYFIEFCNNIGVKSDINSTEILKFFTESIHEILNKNFSSKELIKLLSGLDDTFSELINSNLIKEPVSNIKDQLQISQDSLKNNVKEGMMIGKKLIKNTVSDLRYLKELLGVDHYLYESLTDKLSNQILQCGILYFNDTGDDQSYLSSYKYALSIAPNEKTKSRAKECVKHCKEEITANICWFCEENQISKNLFYRFQMHKWDNSNKFSFNRTYTYFKDGGLKLGCCKSCRSRHNESIFTKLYYYIKGVKRPVIKNCSRSTLRRHPLVLKKIREGYEPGLPNN